MGTGMLAKARELAGSPRLVLCRQFENEANANVHARNHRAGNLVASGPTLGPLGHGIGHGWHPEGGFPEAREERPETQVVVCEPDNQPILGSGIAQERAPDGSPRSAIPASGHTMQAGSDFIPKLAEDVVNAG